MAVAKHAMGSTEDVYRLDIRTSEVRVRNEGCEVTIINEQFPQIQ
jgi:hypothetical protein